MKDTTVSYDDTIRDGISFWVFDASTRKWSHYFYSHKEKTLYDQFLIDREYKL